MQSLNLPLAGLNRRCPEIFTHLRPVVAHETDQAGSGDEESGKSPLTAGGLPKEAVSCIKTHVSKNGR